MRAKIRALLRAGSWAELTVALEDSIPYLNKWEREIHKAKKGELDRLYSHLHGFTDCSGDIKRISLQDHEVELPIDSPFIFVGYLPEKRCIAFDLTLHEKAISELERCVSREFARKSVQGELPCVAVLQTSSTSLTRGAIIVPEQKINCTYPLSPKDWQNLLFA